MARSLTGWNTLPTRNTSQRRRSIESRPPVAARDEGAGRRWRRRGEQGGIIRPPEAFEKPAPVKAEETPLTSGLHVKPR
jgi:hypothetical protein